VTLQTNATSSAMAVVQPSETETSIIGRFVALLTPIFAVVAGAVAGWVAQKIPGVQLDQTQIAAFMVVASTSALTAAWKWLQGLQQHERLVAEGKAKAIKPGGAPTAPTTTLLV
jgi:hypothetical protein